MVAPICVIGFLQSPALGALMTLVGGGGIALLMKWLLAVRRRLVAAFALDGVVRLDGERLAWSALQGVELKMRHSVRGKRPYAVQLVFSGGTAGVGFRASNFAEVIELVRALPVEQRETA